MMSPYLLALFAALSFALGSVLQQKGTLQTKAGEGDPHFLGEILRKPVWLAGGMLQVAGWILQAAALVDGSLVIVQSLCALSLVFALPLGARLTNQKVGRRSIIGAVATLLGVIIFLAIGQPQSGIEQPDTSAWLVAGLSITVIIVLLASQARKQRGTTAAALFATAAGLCYAFQAAVTKVFVNQLGNGVVYLLSSWTTYGLIISALVGFAMQQSALKTGYLAPAMAASNATTLIASALLGAIVFGETLSNGQGLMLPAMIGLGMAVTGVVVLAFPEREVPLQAGGTAGE